MSDYSREYERGKRDGLADGIEWAEGDPEALDPILNSSIADMLYIEDIEPYSLGYFVGTAEAKAKAAEHG